MNIGIYDHDKTKFPNLALMKISAYHKNKGDNVKFYDPIFTFLFDKVYISKVFTFTPDDKLSGYFEKGGTGYDIKKNLPENIEHTCPDYDLYDIDYSMGFVTRGCPNHCKWCIVPEKEGNIKEHADIDEFVRHKKLVLLDNNILASEHGIYQIEKIAQKHIKVDFNQGLDARLIDDKIARLLSKIKWISCIRLACDTQAQMPIIQKTVALLRWYNVNPAKIFVYCLVKDIPESLEIIKNLIKNKKDLHDG